MAENQRLEKRDEPCNVLAFDASTCMRSLVTPDLMGPGLSEPWWRNQSSHCRV